MRLCIIIIIIIIIIIFFFFLSFFLSSSLPSTAFDQFLRRLFEQIIVNYMSMFVCLLCVS